MPKISLSNIEKKYGKGKPAVADLNLELPDGSFTAILGPSGCGKTTTLRMLAGLEQPTNGTITVGDRVFSSVSEGTFVPPNHRNLGLVFQNYALWPHLTVRKNVEFGLAMAKMPKADRKRRSDEMLDLLRVGRLADRLPAQLSGGEQQRVAIARALAPSPNLILFDEPLSNLDAPLRLELSTELKRLHTELGMTALLVTHDQAEAMAVATILIVMKDGAIEQMGTPNEVYRTPATVQVAQFIGNPPMNLLAAEGPFQGLRDLVAATNAVQTTDIARMAIRPEHVLIDSSREGWNLRCSVFSVFATGPATILQLKVSDGSLLTAVVNGETDLCAGREFEVTIELDRVHLFDGDNKRLGLVDAEALFASSSATSAPTPITVIS